MARKRDQPWLISLQAGMQPPGRYSLNHYYGLWPEREGLHLVLQLRESIADRLGYNSAYLGKLFAARTGISFNAYLEKVRIGQARERLVNTDDLVQDIAAGVGYKYIDVFNQKFRKLTGVSPTEYRKMGRSSD